MLHRRRVSLFTLWFCSLNLFSQEQIITNELSLGELRPGQSLQLSIIYDTTDHERTAGLGLRLHFDSSAVELGDLTERLTESVLPFQIKDDTTNLDNNSETDKYFLTAWADTSGQGWPYNSNLPVILYSLPVIAKANFNSVTFQFTGYTAVGYSLRANNIGIALAMKPVISLVGQSEVNLELGNTYTDSGATALDNIDGDITNSILTTSNVDVNTVGTYSVTYNVSDAAGNVANEVTRIVNITPDVTKPIITINGGDIDHEQGTPYTDFGATATDNIDGDITSLITIQSDVDPDNAGTYTVVYSVSDSSGNSADQKTRIVVVSDTTEPVITLIGGDIDHEQGTPYTDLGATALDNIDGDITSSITVESDLDSETSGTYTVVYSVIDSSGNAADQKTRTVVVSDTTKPVITLVGDSEIDLLIDDVYVDNGATAFDNIDGDITGQIITINSVDTSQFGEYFITYNVSDSSGNEAVEVIRLVSVGGTIDMDGNGQYDALSDGLLILRSMFGLRGDALIAGTIGSGATLETAEEIQAEIDLLGKRLDIDDNGSIDALTDGLLILRYLFGLSGNTLTNGVIGSNANRTDNVQIESYISTLTP